MLYILQALWQTRLAWQSSCLRWERKASVVFLLVDGQFLTYFIVACSLTAGMYGRVANIWVPYKRDGHPSLPPYCLLAGPCLHHTIDHGLCASLHSSCPT